MVSADDVGAFGAHFMGGADGDGAGFFDRGQEPLVGFEVGHGGLGFFEFFFCHWLRFLKGGRGAPSGNGLVQTVYE